MKVADMKIGARYEFTARDGSVKIGEFARSALCPLPSTLRVCTMRAIENGRIVALVDVLPQRVIREVK